VRVGRELAAERHPHADRLQLCSVDVGEAEAYQIVCGAWNFGAGATVAVALPGATLPNGLVLEQRELRGSVSQGMILAEDEVELGPDHSGIMVLPSELEPGTPLADVLPLVEEVLEVETTGNRPDLLSIYGLAREVSALFDVPLAPWPGTEPARDGDESVDVTLDGQQCELDPRDLLIADGERAVAIAGIMGGEETEVSAATTAVLLEAANFEPVSILHSSERLGLRTEGSNRWEKGVDPYLPEHAARLASQLLVELSGARWV